MIYGLLLPQHYQRWVIEPSLLPSTKVNSHLMHVCFPYYINYSACFSTSTQSKISQLEADVYVTATLMSVIKRMHSNWCANVNIIPVEISVISAVNHLCRKNGEKQQTRIPMSVNVS